MTLVYGVETWPEIWPEAAPMFSAHASEVEPGRRDAFDLNEPLAREMSRLDLMHIQTVRDGVSGPLLGYCIWYLGPSLDSPVSSATQGPWYVVPEWRHSRAGLKVFMESLEALRTLGVRRVIPHHWFGGGGERLGKFFARLGAMPLEVSFSLYLDEVK